MISTDYQMFDEGKLKLVITGKLDAEATGHLWSQVVRKITEVKPPMLVVDASRIEYCDVTGIGLLLDLKRKQESNKKQIHIEGLKPEFKQLIRMFDPGQMSKPEVGPASFIRIAEDIGKAIVGLLMEMRTLISFVGELFIKFLQTYFLPYPYAGKMLF